MVKCTLEDINIWPNQNSAWNNKGKLDTAMQLRGVTLARARTSMKRA